MCKHGYWTAKQIPLSDGRPALREFCVQCGKANGGTRLGYAIPMASDRDLYVPSYKYPGKTLGEIYDENPDYIRWLAKDSKVKKRFKLAAARIYAGKPYYAKQDGEIYTDEEKYNPEESAELLSALQQ